MYEDVDVLALTPAQVGRLGEHLCARYLERRGIRVLEQNWRCSVGEVDIVADDDDTRILVEVKTRVSPYGDAMPEVAVDDAKVKRYERLARVYLGRDDAPELIRFDVAGVVLTKDRVARIHYIEGAWAGDV